ncbi:potassium channel family protein [Thalassoroseus pseudoceratinae]|uniref:potassium channel family protein n=1 Tax=Thalassoroseus pseudoceratinae TaxID=2713176 RepID=UPI0014231D8A|nr:potassium channel protein [Thalassoroseus pseudoceratinae]
MQSSLRKILVGAIFFICSCWIAICAYCLAGWSFLEAVYMVTITIFGVGYGEVRPIEQTSLKIFTIGFIISGCTSSIYFLGGCVQMLAEGEINKALGARRMTRGIDRLTNHVIVCGYGRVGQILARDLKESDQSHVIIDVEKDRLQTAETAGHLVIHGDATDETVLQAAGVERARVLASVLSDDTANVFITLTARGLNEQMEIIARGEKPTTESKLLRSGANRVVLPAAIGASLISHLITRPSTEVLLSEAQGTQTLNDDLNRIGLKMTDVPITTNSGLVGSPIGDLNVTGMPGVVTVALRRQDGTVVRKPKVSATLDDGDTLILLSHHDTTIQLSLRKSSSAPRQYRGVKLGS